MVVNIASLPSTLTVLGGAGCLRDGAGAAGVGAGGAAGFCS